MFRFLDPDRMTHEEQKRVGRWLEANGETEWIALEPVRVLFGRAYYRIWSRENLTQRDPIATSRRIRVGLRHVA